LQESSSFRERRRSKSVKVVSGITGSNTRYNGIKPRLIKFTVYQYKWAKDITCLS